MLSGLRIGKNRKDLFMTFCKKPFTYKRSENSHCTYASHRKAPPKSNLKITNKLRRFKSLSRAVYKGHKKFASDSKKEKFAGKNWQDNSQFKSTQTFAKFRQN